MAAESEIKNLCAQWEPYREGILVRYRTREGFTHRFFTKDRDKAHEQFLIYVELLRIEGKHNGQPKRTETPRDAWTAV